MKIRIAEDTKNLRTLQGLKARLATEKRRERLEKIAEVFQVDLRDPETFELCVQIADDERCWG